MTLVEALGLVCEGAVIRQEQYEALTKGKTPIDVADELWEVNEHEARLMASEYQRALKLVFGHRNVLLRESSVQREMLRES